MKSMGNFLFNPSLGTCKVLGHFFSSGTLFCKMGHFTEVLSYESWFRF
jgi:hypothetical protein